MHRSAPCLLSQLSLRPLALGLMVLLAASPLVDLQAAQAQGFTPSGRGMPGRRFGGGTRGSGSVQTAAQPLTALIPQTNLGLTTAERPTFFWYVPPTAAVAAEFVLLDEQNAEVYQTTLPIAGQTGVVALSLPADAPPLETGQPYRWYFSLVNDPLDRSADTFTEGWVERVAPSPQLTAQLATASEAEKFTLYTEAGIWHEAIATLATLRQQQPADPDLIQQWQVLLQSVELTNIADQPLAAPPGF